jgi:hypothetical protein
MPVRYASDRSWWAGSDVTAIIFAFCDEQLNFTIQDWLNQHCREVPTSITPDESTMNNPTTEEAEPVSLRRWIYRLLCVVLALSCTGYFVWGLYTEQGVVGWMLDLQMSVLGWASLKLTVLVISFVVIPAYFGLTLALGEVMKVGDAEMMSVMLGSEHVGSASAQGLAATPGGSMKPLLWMAAIPTVFFWAAGYLWFLWVTSSEAERAASTPPTLNVEQVSEPKQLAEPTKLLATPLLERALVYESNQKHFYIPLADNGGEPLVRVVLHIATYNDLTREAVSPPYVVERIRSGLPDYARKEFERGGVRFSGEVVVVEPVEVTADGKPRDKTSLHRFTFLVVGGLATFWGLSLLAVAYGTRRKQRKAAGL